VQSGIASNCNDFYLVQAGDGCWAIANDHGIELNDFYGWNPAVKNDCGGLQAEVYVCVGVKGSATTTSENIPSTTLGGIGSTPTPIQDGMVTGCKDFYFVQAGDGCWAIANDRGIELNDFYEWNPAVKNDCSGLQAKVYVCVGI
jgi:LysM repeat protein